MQINIENEVLEMLEQKNTYIDMLQREIECLKQENKTLRRERDEWKASNFRFREKNIEIIAAVNDCKRAMGRFY